MTTALVSSLLPILLFLHMFGSVEGQRRNLQRVIQQLRSSPRYRPTSRPPAHQLIGTGGLRLQSERAQGGGGGGVVASRRRVDVGQLHWQDVPPSYRQHRATARGLPDLIASILPQKKKYRGNEKKKKKAFKAKKRVDKSKFNPPKVAS